MFHIYLCPRIQKKEEQKELEQDRKSMTYHIPFSSVRNRGRGWKCSRGQQTQSDLQISEIRVVGFSASQLDSHIVEKV